MWVTPRRNIPDVVANSEGSNQHAKSGSPHRAFISYYADSPVRGATHMVLRTLDLTYSYDDMTSM